MKELSDGQLAALAQAGDKEAFGELVERCQSGARRIALRMLANEDIAHEIVQEALLEAYLSLGRLRQLERFKSWLYGIVLNLCRNYLREQKRRAAPFEARLDEEVIDLLQAGDAPPGLQEIAEERELHWLVLAAIQDLSSKDRRTVLLFYFEYLSIQEIAALSGVSTGAVKVRLHRARSQLRQRLQDQIPEWKPYQKFERRRFKMVEVRIADVIKREDKTIVFLLNEEGNRALPIWIGQFEGAFIAAGVRDFSTPRPMTFSFIANILEALGAQLEEARVESLRGDTFYGVAKLRSGEQVVEVDARPSDVLALAARAGCPIRVAEDVMEKAGRPVQPGLEYPADLKESEPELPPELPLPTGEGIDGIIQELEAMLQRPPSRSGSEQEKD